MSVPELVRFVRLWKPEIVERCRPVLLLVPVQMDDTVVQDSSKYVDPRRRRIDPAVVGKPAQLRMSGQRFEEHRRPAARHAEHEDGAFEDPLSHAFDPRLARVGASCNTSLRT